MKVVEKKENKQLKIVWNEKKVLSVFSEAEKVQPVFLHFVQRQKSKTGTKPGWDKTCSVVSFDNMPHSFTQ